MIITLLAFFTELSVKTGDAQLISEGRQIFHKRKHCGDNSNYRLSFRVGFQGLHFREGSELLKTRKEVPTEGNTNSPPAPGSLRE